VVRHEDVSARGVELIQSDDFDAHSGKPHPCKCAPYEHAVEQANVAGDQRPGKADERGKGRGHSPEREHDERAEHGFLALSSEQ